MLSNPWLESSGGSSAETSMSTASNSRIELAYSVRFKRCNGCLPAFGLAAAAWSTEFSKYETSALRAAALGRGAPGGGIMPTRSMLTAFSTCSAFRSGCARSMLAQEKLPDFSLAL